MFDATKVKRVYSGRKGCACGCLGKYTRADGVPLETHEGIDVQNQTTVNAVVRKMEEAIRFGNVEWLMWTDDVVGIDLADRNRSYTLYMK